MMTSKQIREALAHSMGWHEEMRDAPWRQICWVTDEGVTVRTVSSWNPLESDADVWTLVDALTARGITPNTLFYSRGNKEWSMSWTARGPKIFDSLATDVSRRRAIRLSALLVLGIAVEEEGNHA